MDGIEFNMEPSRDDFSGALIKMMQMSTFFRTYYILGIAGIAILILLAKINEIHAILYVNLMVVIGFALVVPIAVALGIARRKVSKSFYREEVRFIIDNEGYRVKTDTSEFFMKWQGFDYIKETQKYIFMKPRNKRPPFVIYTSLLPGETTSSIKKLLANAPVVKKHLL